MESSVTRGLFNLDSLNEATKGTIHKIDIEQIEENKLNSLYSQDDIDGLKDNIKEFQLSQPLVVKKIGNNMYRLISGHRRLKACKQLFAEGELLYFFNKEFNGCVPCIFDEKEYVNEDDELLAIISSNSQRILSKKERKQIYEALQAIYDHKCANGEKPPGKAREVISKWMGVSARTVQNYKTELLEEPVSKTGNKEKIVKRFVSLEKYFTDLDVKTYSSDELKEIREIAIPAINAILQCLNIDIDRL